MKISYKYICIVYTTRTVFLKSILSFFAAILVFSFLSAIVSAANSLSPDRKERRKKLWLGTSNKIPQ